MVGIPAISIPTGWASENFLGTTSLPEIAVYKSTEQRAVVKVAVFAYNRKTNTPLWQSGNILTESRIRARWLFGAGPFSKGDICNGTELAGSSLNPTITQIIDLDSTKAADKPPAPGVTLEAFYVEHDESGIPVPKLDSLHPGAEAKPDAPENTEQLLAADSPESKAKDAPDAKSPPTPPDNGVQLASAQTSYALSADVPSQGQAATNAPGTNAVVPNASTFPWQNPPTNATQPGTSQSGAPQFVIPQAAPLAPGFTGY